MTLSTAWKEIIPDGEAARLEALAEEILAMQRRNARKAPVSRALHAKGIGVEGEFTVLSDVPEHARVGLFAKPASYRAFVRFSNGMGRRVSDKKPDVRGVAVKLVGVDGKKIIPGLENAKTQDFLMIHSPATPFRDSYEFVWLLRAAEIPPLLPLRAFVRFGPGRAIRVIKQLLKNLGQPMPSVATTPYYSAVPIRFGAYAAEYGLLPRASAGDAPGAKTAEHLREELTTRLAKEAVIYDFRVQFFVDEERTPIEDASRPWDAPWVTLARLTLPKQDLESAAGKALAEQIEKLSFDPWHAGEDFRPLGNIMRARNAAYRVSTKERGAAPEPETF